MDSATIRFVDQRFLIAGKLHFANVMSIYAESLPHLLTAREVEFDFSQVSACDSAGLALIIEWIKFTRQKNIKIALKHLSGEVMALARASSLDKILMPG